MNSPEASELGLFPLGVVLLPGELLPLHIFEERYKRLVAEREADGDEFVIVLAEDDGVRRYGCTARITEVLARYDDGRLDLVVRGGRRCRLLEVIEPAAPEEDYLRALVEPHEDSTSRVPDELRASVLEAFARMLRLMDASPAEAADEETPLSFRLGAAADFGAALKQELLESIGEEDRLTTLLAVIEGLIPRLELRKEREEAIRGNGKGY
jgi:Lon protease-like protein